LAATDPDAGENGRVRYALEGTHLFGIDPNTGTIHLLRQDSPKTGDGGEEEKDEDEDGDGGEDVEYDVGDH
jgi:hypothetical protein